MKTRTTIMIDAKLLERAMRKAGVKTKSAAVEAALKAYVRGPDFWAVLDQPGIDAVTVGSARKKKAPARSR